MAGRGISTRALTSLMSAAGLLVMGLTGLVAYVMPQGRVAYWTDWRLLGLSKTQWGDIHIISSILFLVAAGFHLYLNWKPFVGYLRAKAARAAGLRRELVLALAALALVVAAGVAPFPPFSWLLDLNQWAKDAWVATPAHEPPFGHAEELALGAFAKKMRIPPEAALAELRAAGYQVPGLRATLLSIARANGARPMELYAAIRHLEKAPPQPAGGAYTAAGVEEAFAGTGIGNKTLAGVAEMSRLSQETLRARLAAKGLEMGGETTVKQAADAGGLASPLEMLKALLVEDYQPRRD
jgi:hypothetical protein